MKLALCIKKSEAPASVIAAFEGQNPSLIEIGPEFWTTPTYMVDRDLCETDTNLLQLLPYVAVRNLRGEVFRYTRGGGGAEARLHGNYSIGLGGHVDNKPTQPDRLGYLLQREAVREIAEEVGISIDPQALDITHFIADPSNSVGRVHLGLLIVYTLNTEQAEHVTECLEVGNIVDGQMLSAADLYKDYSRLENWSAMVLDKLCIDDLSETAYNSEMGAKESMDAATDTTFSLKA